MTSNKNLHVLQNKQKLCKKCKQEKYLEGSVLNLRNLFEMPNSISRCTSSCSYENTNLDGTEEIEKTPLTEIKWQSLNSRPAHHEFESTGVLLPFVSIEHPKAGVSHSNSNEFHKSKSIEMNKETLSISESLNSVVKVDFEVMVDSSKETKFIKIIDDDDDVDDCAEIQDNVQNNIEFRLENNDENAAPSISKTALNKSHDVVNLERNKCCSALHLSKALKADENNKHSFKIKLYSPPQLNTKLKTIPTTTRNRPASETTVLPQFNKSVDDLKVQAKNTLENCKPETTNLNLENSTVFNKDYKILAKDFTQNIIEIAKEIIQSIQGVLFKSFKSTSADELHEIKSPAKNNSQNLQFHLKLKVYNATPHETEILPSTSNDMDATTSSNSSTQNIKLSESERSEILNTGSKFEQRLVEQKENPTNSRVCKKSSQLAKNKCCPFLKRQLELHHLRAQVEEKRLKLLDLKMAREWDEMQREKFIFEKYFLAKYFDFQKSHHSVDA